MCDPLAFVYLEPRQSQKFPFTGHTRTHVDTKTPARPRRGHLQAESSATGTPQDLVNPWTLAFGPSGDSLYVATDPNHRTVHRFDAAGKLVRAERCADEAPNYLLCV